MTCSILLIGKQYKSKQLHRDINSLPPASSSSFRANNFLKFQASFKSLTCRLTIYHSLHNMFVFMICLAHWTPLTIDSTRLQDRIQHMPPNNNDFMCCVTRGRRICKTLFAAPLLGAFDGVFIASKSLCPLSCKWSFGAEATAWYLIIAGSLAERPKLV